MTSLLVTSDMDVCRKQRVVIDFFREGLKQVEIVESLKKCIEKRYCPSLPVYQWLDIFK